MNTEPLPEVPETAEMPEAEIERLLGSAYDAPPVPKALRRRIEQTMAGQPDAVPLASRRGMSALRRTVRSWKVWPAAMCLALAFVLAVAYRGNAHTCRWADVVEALSRQEVVQLGVDGAGESESAWLSISRGMIGRRSGDLERLYDLHQGVVLERGISDSRIRRFRLSETASVRDREQVALSFLVGSRNVEGDFSRLRAMHVRKESWSRLDGLGELKVVFGSAASGESLQLTLRVDPETHLPQSCLVSNQQGVLRNEKLLYPATRPEQLAARAFPPDLPIVDAGDRIAAAGSDAVAASPNAATNTDRGSEPATSTQRGAAAANAEVALTGAASLGWSPIAPATLSGDELVAEIDALLQRLWREQDVTPAEPASDAELLRRVYLDLAGRTPTVAEVRDYLNDRDADRYVSLVDRLLGSPDHATHLATVWRTFLLPEGVDLSRFGGVGAFDEWLSGRFGANVPYDRLVRELLLAEGRLSQSGPLLFYSAAKLDADQLAARTARVFLGMRLDCAQCHDDPFEPWTQQDFWSYAAFFARISRPQAALESVSTVMRVRDIDRGEVSMPRSKDPVAPKYLDGSTFDDAQATARRQQLAAWLTSPENPFFVRAAVNRVWAHLFGRGIVDPVDGFGKRHQASSPELLDLLAGRFIAGNFNLRETFRTIVLTRAYRLSSGGTTEDGRRQKCFAQMNVKMLTAEQVYDCITVASMLVAADTGDFSIARVGNAGRDEFLQQFRTLVGRPTEYQGGIPQALTLMNGTLINSATDLARGGLLKSLEAPFFTDDQRIEVIYLATLSRRPTSGEWKLLRGYLGERDPGASVQEPLADILWSLLNSAEFTMNH
jgi:hypothetical protein